MACAHVVVDSSAGVTSRRCSASGPREPLFRCFDAYQNHSALAQESFTHKIMQDLLIDSTDFGGRVFVVAVHEQHPFVFFDCDQQLALCGFSTQEGGSESCGVRTTSSEPTQCTVDNRRHRLAAPPATSSRSGSGDHFSVHMVIRLPVGRAAMTDTMRDKVKIAISNVAEVRADLISISSLSDSLDLTEGSGRRAHRRLLQPETSGGDSEVEITIIAQSAQHAAEIASRLTIDALNTAFEIQNVAKITAITSDAAVLEPSTAIDCSDAQVPTGLSSTTPSADLPQWACGKVQDGQGAGKFRKGKENGGCDFSSKYYPFCGISIDILDAICHHLNCKLEFFIANKNPHHWSSPHKALCAIGAWQAPGTSHWADIAAGAIHVDPTTSEGAMFTTPYYQTGYRLLVPRADSRKNWFAFKETFDDWMYAFGIYGEIFVIGAILFYLESPEMPWNLGKVWYGKTNYQDTDVVPGWINGCFDCMYWSFTGGWKSRDVFVCLSPECRGDVLVHTDGFVYLCADFHMQSTQPSSTRRHARGGGSL